MIRSLTLVLVLAFSITTGAAAARGGGVAAARKTSCDVPSASPWISRWLAAWDLASREILRLPDAPAPNIVFYDSSCVYTTSSVTAPGAPAVDGPALSGTTLRWRAMAHGDTLTLPNSQRLPVGLLSFANLDRATGPFFVMAAPSYWERALHSQDIGLTGVFLHEFAHTRQIRGMAAVIGPIDSTWRYPEELDDDAVQTHFASDSVYVASYLAERDLLYRAAAADSLAEVRALARQALAMMRRRHARWFRDDKAMFAILDDTFLSLEGAGQWTAYAWLAHPAGGRLDREAAVKRMLGRRRRWSQDEGLALFLVVDRLMPAWPSLVFDPHAIGATALLERAIDS